ncbi:hypothetical protein [Streptomyces sp. NPDC058382]|uniref:hypothetical protein n=1 Tax=unclassified Streptomyces TaxID=2593676 RepID=UPI00362891CA
MDVYEQARGLLNAVIAAYSSRISTAPDPQTTQSLRAERAPIMTERDALSADDRDRIAEIISTGPDRLAAVRRSAADE